MNWNKKITALNALLAEVAATDGNMAALDVDIAFTQLKDRVADIKISRNAIFFIGNGASASMCSHFAADFAKNGKIHTQTFTDLSLITAVANDLSYEKVFADPLRFRARSGDMLVAISSSGASPNILEAVKVAKDKGMYILTLSGMKPENPLRKQGEINFYIPGETYGMVETCHAAVLHYWMDLVA
ncbi:MAG: SIS domain-containing protein [Fibrobacteria bacterium]|nr:SIS domain-containing protein [Fibrobacteria bacterium]